MKFKERNKRRIISTVDIKSLLWLSFTALLLIVVAVVAVSEYFLLNRTYKETVAREQLSYCRNLCEKLENQTLTYDAINHIVISAIADSGENIYILGDDGVVYFPSLEGQEIVDNQADLLATIKEKLADKQIGESVSYSSDGLYCRVAVIVINGVQCYLYMATDITVSPWVSLPFVVQIVTISLIVLISSSIVIAIISSRISEPISSINQKAKKLGAGDFEVDFYTSLDSCKEIHELSSTLNATRDELSKADQMQKELIANVTHDFKTPLTMIKAYASMIQEISGDNPEKRNKHCQVIIDESDRLASLVNDLLEISKIRAGINTLKPTVFNLSEFTETIVDRFGYLRDTQGYKIETDITPDLYTEADKDKIGQVIYNLIGNAVNYTGEDKTIKIRLISGGNSIRFDVKDTGAGISADEIEHIWDRYYRSKDNHRRPVQGTGLGLSIVKTVLTKHNFKFGVTSELGKGSTFYVDFPLRTVWNIESADSDE